MSLDILLLSLDRLAIHLFQQTEAKLNIANEHVASAAGKVLSDDNSQHLHFVGVGRHGVCRDNPAARSEVVRQGEFVVVSIFTTTFVRSGEAERYEGKTISRALGHDDEALLLEVVAKVVGCASKVAHDGPVALLAETNQLVVLANDLGGTLGEVQSKR